MKFEYSEYANFGKLKLKGKTPRQRCAHVTLLNSRKLNRVSGISKFLVNLKILKIFDVSKLHF